MIQILVGVTKSGEAIDVPFFLDSIAPKGGTDQSLPATARWTCFSPYLGRNVTGHYFVQALAECEKQRMPGPGEPKRYKMIRGRRVLLPVESNIKYSPGFD